MRRNFIGIAVLSIMALSFLSGCESAPEPTKPAAEVVKEAFENSLEMKAYSYEVLAKADLSGGGERVNFNVLLNGIIDSINPEKPLFSMKLKGSFSDGREMDGNADAEIRMNREAIYLNVANILIEGEELPAEFTDMFGKWYNIPLSEDDFKELQASFFSVDREMTSEEKELFSLIEEMFTEPKYTDTESVRGEQSWVYEVALDSESLINAMKKYAASQGSVVTDEDMAEARDMLKDVVVTGKLSVGTKSNVINQVTIDMKFTGDGEEVPAGTASFRFTFGDIDKAQSIQVPASFEEFPMEALYGPLMMLGGMTSSFSDDVMMEDYSMEDYNMGDYEIPEGEGEFSEEDLAQLEALLKEMEGFEGIEDIELAQ